MVIFVMAINRLAVLKIIDNSVPFTEFEVLRERSKLLRKVVYSVDESWTKKMPEKTQGNDIKEEFL